MLRRAPYTPHPRRHRPLSERGVREHRRLAGRIAFWCVVLAALVLILGTVDWARLERAAEGMAREAERDAVRQLRERVRPPMDRPGPPGARRPSWAPPVR